MGNKGIMHAMRSLNQQEDDITQALDLSLRNVKAKQAALAKAKEAHARHQEVFQANLKKIKKRAEELNELLGCSKLMQQEDPERHRSLLKPVTLQEIAVEDEDDEAVVERTVVKKRVGGIVSRGQREASQARFADQLKKGRVSKLNASAKLKSNTKLRRHGQTTRLFDNADAARRGRASRKNVTVPDEEDDSDSSETPQEARDKRPIVRQDTGSEIEVAREDTPQDENDFEPDARNDTPRDTANFDDGESLQPRRDTGASSGGLFSFDMGQPRLQSDRRPVTSRRGRSDARREAQLQGPAPEDDDAWHALGNSPEPETGGRSVRARPNSQDRYAGEEGYPAVGDRGDDFDDDAASIASDSSDGLFVSERAPTASSRGSTPDYMLRASPEPEATRHDENGSGAHVKKAAPSQKRVASRSRFSEQSPLQPLQTTTSVPIPDAQLLQHFTMASRRGNQSTKPSESGEQPGGEFQDPADVPVPSIEGAHEDHEDSIKSEDEEDEDHMDTSVDRPKQTGFFSFDKYMPTARGDNQSAQGEPTSRPAYASPTWQERIARVRAAHASAEDEAEDAQEDEDQEDILNPWTEQRQTSNISNTVKHPNNRSRLSNSMTPDDTMRADRGMSTPGSSDGAEGSPGVGWNFEDGENEVEREGTEDPSSDFESTPKTRSKKKATGTKKGKTKRYRRAPGTRCGECFRLHRKCTHTDPSTGAGDEEEDEENADPKYLAMRARKRAAQQSVGSMPTPKRTHYNTYGPDPEPVLVYPKKTNGLTFDIGSAIAGKILGDAKKHMESEGEGTPEKEGTPGKNSQNEGDGEGDDGGEDDGDEE